MPEPRHRKQPIISRSGSAPTTAKEPMAYLLNPGEIYHKNPFTKLTVINLRLHSPSHLLYLRIQNDHPEESKFSQSHVIASDFLSVLKNRSLKLNRLKVLGSKCSKNSYLRFVGCSLNSILIFNRLSISRFSFICFGIRL